MSKFVILEDSKAGERKNFGNIEASDVGFLRSGREGEFLGMIAPVPFGGNSWGIR